MSLEDLLEKAKKAHKDKKELKKVRGPRVVSMPANGRITDYGSVPQEEVERALQLHKESPDDHDARAYLAFLNYASKEYDQAIEHFRYLLEQGFKPANQHFYLGNCHYQKGEKKKARQHWEKSLELGPAEGIARQVRQRLEWVSGD